MFELWFCQGKASSLENILILEKKAGSKTSSTSAFVQFFFQFVSMKIWIQLRKQANWLLVVFVWNAMF